MARFWQQTKDRLTAPAQYIQETDSVSRPLAVMMTLVLFFVAAAVVVALLFAGKWGYDQIAGNNNAPANPVTGISTGASTSSGMSSGASNQNTGSTATVTSNGAGTAAVTSTQPSTTSVTSSTSSQTSTSTSVSAVPNTGAGSMLAIFGLSSVIGMLCYRFMLLRKLN